MSVYTAIQSLTPNGEVLSIFNPQIFTVASTSNITVAQAQISGDLNVQGTSTLDGETLLNALEVTNTTQTRNLEVFNNAQFFGSCEVPTLPQNSNNDKVASTKYCDTAISNLVNGSPQLLDTLSELSQALNNDNNFASNITNLISTKAGLTLPNTFSNTNTFSGSVQFTSNLNGVDPTTFSYISNITDDAQEQLNTLGESVSNLNDLKANITYVDQADQTLQTNINTLQTNVQSQLDNLSSTKANLSYVEQADQILQSNIVSAQTNLQGQIDSLSTTKANLTYVQQADQGLQNNISTFQTNLQSQLDNLSTTKANLTYVQQSDELLQNQINTKASSVYVDTVKSNLETSISSLETQTNNSLATKASITYVDTTKNNLENSISTLTSSTQSQLDNLNLVKANITYVDGIETSLVNSISTLETNVNSQLSTLSSTKANITYVDSKISDLVSSAPETLNTLKELSDALGADPNFSTTISNQLGLKASIAYVDNADSLLQTQITNLSSTKANQIYVEQADQTLQSNITNVQTNLQNQINTLGTSKANLSYVQAQDQILQTNIDNLQTSTQTSLNAKANITDLETLSTNVDTELDNLNASKLEVSEFNYYLGTLQSDIATKASTSYVDTQLLTKASKTELANEVSTLQTAINTLSTNKANISYVDSAISNLVSSAPETLNTLSELASALGSDPNFSTTIATEIGTKASTLYVDTINTNLQGQIDSKANTQYVNDQLALKANIAYVDNVDLQLQTQIDSKAGLSYVNTQLDTKATTTYVDSTKDNLQSQIDTKASTTYVNTQLDTKATITYVDTATTNLQGQIDSLDTSKASTSYVDTAISNLVSSAPETLNTLNELALALGSDANFSTTVTNSLATKANDSDVVHLTGAETIGGVKTFSDNVIVPSLNGISNTTIGYLSGVTSSIQTQLDSKMNSTGGSFVDLTTNDQIITGNKTWNNLNSFQRIVERMQTLTVSSNQITLDYSTGNIAYVVPPSATNMILNLNNVPLSSYSGSTFTITIIINAQTNKAYVNSLFVNGGSAIMRYAGGVANVSLTSAIFAVQTITVLVVPGATTVGGVLTSVTQWF